jgi:Sugar (and other) transporter
MCAATNRSTVVEITPPGIQSLGWQFYIIWTVFNGAFVPIVYLFYPETADRTLEDIDRMYRENPKLLVFRDKTITSSKRPAEYIEHEQEQVRRNSSVDAATLRRGSRIKSPISFDNNADYFDHTGGANGVNGVNGEKSDERV